MKHRFIFLLLLSASFGSCCKDLSTEAARPFPDIVIEGDGETLNAVYGSVLSIEPDIRQEGYTEEDFSYLWEVDLIAQKAANRIEIANTRKLEYRIGQTPSNDPYALTLTVTNKVLGYSCVACWNLYVTNSIGEGLLVAHTRDGGLSSDLDFFATGPVTYGYTGVEPAYIRNLYSFANEGKPIEGTVNQMTPVVSTTPGRVYGNRHIVIGTDSAIISLDPLTYREDRRNATLFNFYEQEGFATQAVFNFCSGVSGAVVENRLYSMLCNNESVYNKVALNTAPDNFFYKENTASVRKDQSRVCAFNAHDGTFYQVHGWISVMSSLTPLNVYPSFDTQGAVAVGTGGMYDLTLGYVIKDAKGRHHLCIVNVNANKIDDYPLDAPHIDRAVDFAFLDNANIVYYATEDKIYVITVSGDRILVSALSWEPEASGERITSIDQYVQAWYGTQQIGINDYAFTLPANRMQLIITTYNDSTGEGKVYLRPFNINTGKFTFSSNGTYSGFGRITAICPTLR